MSFSYICVFLQASALLHLWPAAGISDPRVVWWELPAFSATELDQRHILRQQWSSLVYKNLPAEAQNWSPDRLGSEWQSRLSAACLIDKWNTQVNKYLSFSCGELSVLINSYHYFMIISTSHMCDRLITYPIIIKQAWASISAYKKCLHPSKIPCTVFVLLLHFFTFQVKSVKVSDSVPHYPKHTYSFAPFLVFWGVIRWLGDASLVEAVHGDAACLILVQDVTYS